MTHTILVGQDERPQPQEHQLLTSFSANGSDQQPPRHTLTGFSFEENEPEQQHTHASTTEHADGSIEPNLVEMTTEELYAFVNKSISSLHLYDWNPEEGWTPTSWKEAQS